MLKDFNEKIITEHGLQYGLSGQLKLHNEKIMHIELESHNDLIGERDSIEWNVKRHGKITTLKNTLYESFIYPQYLVNGHNVPKTFDGFLVRLSFVSEWLLRWSGTERIDDSFVINFPKEIFSIKIKKPDGSLAEVLSSPSISTKKSKDKRDVTEVEQFYYIEIKYEKSKKIEYMMNDAQHLRRLFSFILGTPIDIEEFLLKSNGRNISVLFNNSLSYEKTWSPVNAIIDASNLDSKNLWGTIFNSFFSPKSYKRFEGIWSRFFGVMAHDGYWDYGVFGCVSLLEAYCSIHCSDIDERLPDDVFAQLSESYIGFISNHEKEVGSHPEIFSGLKGMLGKSRNTRFPTFDMKFDKLIADTPKVIVDAINLTPEEFKHIKDIRNKVAHGGSPSLLIEGDISHEMMIKSKLMVLIIYYIYKDLGLDENYFVLFLYRRFNPILRYANLNDEAIDKASKSVPFIEIDSVSFAALGDTNLFNVVFEFDKKSNILKFESKITKSIKSDWPGSPVKHRNLEHFVFEKAKELYAVQSVCYIDFIYVTFGELSKKISSACIINPNDEMQGYGRSYSG